MVKRRTSGIKQVDLVEFGKITAVVYKQGVYPDRDAFCHIETHCMRVMTARSAKSDNLRHVYCVFQYGID